MPDQSPQKETDPRFSTLGWTADSGENFQGPDISLNQAVDESSAIVNNFLTGSSDALDPALNGAEVGKSTTGLSKFDEAIAAKSQRAEEKLSSKSPSLPTPQDLTLHDPNADAHSIHELYHYSTRMLANLSCSIECNQCLRARVDIPLERQLSMMYMWAQGLDLRFLQIAVDRSTQLQATVVRELVGIVKSAQILLDGRKPSSKNDPIARNIDSFIQNFTDPSNQTGSESDSSSTESDEADEAAGPDKEGRSEFDHHRHVGSLRRLKMQVRCLMDLLPTLVYCCDEERMKSGHREAAASTEKSQAFQVTQPYVIQIQDKFPSINKGLAIRLGEANWSRFKRLQKLVATNKEQREDVEYNDESSSEDEELKAIEFRPVSEFHDSGLGASLPAKSRFAPSIASHTSFLSTESISARGAARVPPTPAEVEKGTPFVCSLCGLTLSHIRNRIDWKMHVFSDIQPYICMSSDCKDSRVTFPSRTLWAEHEFEHHRAQEVWRCFECSLDMKSSDTLSTHLFRAHADKAPVSMSEMRAMLAAAKTSVVNLPEQSCPMCSKTTFKTRREWTTHVGKHMEEVALIALPRTADSDDEGDDKLSTASDVLNLGQETGGSDKGKLPGSEEILDDDPEGVKIPLPLRGGYSDDFEPTPSQFSLYAQELNPKLEPYLTDRIGCDNVRSFQRLMKYKLNHKMSVEKGECTSGDFCTQLGGKAKLLPPRSNHGNFAVGSDLRLESDPDEELPSEGIVTPALFPQGIPLPPTTHLPAEFECPLCFRVKKILKPSDWTKHVHEDVQPFSCTFPNCPEPKSFKRKVDWIRHENERHRHLEWWRCSVNECSHICYRKDNFVQHLIREHRMEEPRSKPYRATSSSSTNFARKTREQEDAQFWRLVEKCRFETPKTPRDEPCKFCGNVCSTWKKLTIHMGKHMEQIAMPFLGLLERAWSPSHLERLVSDPHNVTTWSGSKATWLTPDPADPFSQRFNFDPFSEQFNGLPASHSANSYQQPFSNGPTHILPEPATYGQAQNSYLSSHEQAKSVPLDVYTAPYQYATYEPSRHLDGSTARDLPADDFSPVSLTQFESGQSAFYENWYGDSEQASLFVPIDHNNSIRWTDYNHIPDSPTPAAQSTEIPWHAGPKSGPFPVIHSVNPEQDKEENKQVDSFGAQDPSLESSDRIDTLGSEAEKQGPDKHSSVL